MPYIKGAKTKPTSPPVVVGEKPETETLDKKTAARCDQIVAELEEDRGLRLLLIEEMIDCFCLVCAAPLDADSGQCEEGCDEEGEDDEDAEEDDEGDDGEPDDELEEEEGEQ